MHSDEAGPPVFFLKYGWLTPEGRLEYLGKVSNTTRTEAISQWQATALTEKLAGDMYWQFGLSGLSFGKSTNVSCWFVGRPCMHFAQGTRRGTFKTYLPRLSLPPCYQDGFTIFLEDAEAKKLVYDHVKAYQRLNN